MKQPFNKLLCDNPDVDMNTEAMIRQARPA